MLTTTETIGALQMKTLKELLAEKAQAKLAQQTTIDKVVEAKIDERAETTASAINSNLNSNIKVETKNAPTTLKPTLKEILADKNAKLSHETQNTPATSNVIRPIIAEATKKLTLAEKLALVRKSQEAIGKELNVTTVEEAKAFIQNEVKTAEAIVPTAPTAKDSSNVVSNIKESLKEKLLRLANEKKVQAASTVLGIDTSNSGIMTEDTPYDTVVDKEVLSVQRPTEQTTTPNVVQESVRKNETFALDIVLNERQQAAVSFAESGKSFVLLGAAGTGKTSSEGAMLHKILASPTLKATSFKISGSENRREAPSVAVVAYTRRAAANSAKAILKDPVLREKIPFNIMTIHSLLEFTPEVYYDVATNEEKFRFSPNKTATNPLTITHLIIEESTLLGLDLWEQLFDALPYDVQIIFVGDINQLPPVFGPSILNYAITRLPVVELQEVYRQALGSPIIGNAHRILKGEVLEEGANEQGKLQIISGKNEVKIGQAKTAAAFRNLFKQFYDNNLYNPDEDMILSPWGKQELGTVELNKMIAEFLSVKNNTLVYEVIAGYNKLYLAEGDKVLCNKQDAIIVSIEPNPAYIGVDPAVPGIDLSRYGVRRMSATQAHLLDEEDTASADTVADYSNFSIEALEDTAMERKMQASHKITLAYESGYTETIQNAGDLAPSVFQLGYAMTVHKSQGSEWRRVFIVFHPDHMVSLNRELLYTAITRAREEVYILSKRYVLDKVVNIQKVKGNTLEDKIAIFNSGVVENNASTVRVTKPSLANR